MQSPPLGIHWDDEGDYYTVKLPSGELRDVDGPLHPLLTHPAAPAPAVADMHPLHVASRSPPPPWPPPPWPPPPPPPPPMQPPTRRRPLSSQLPSVARLGIFASRGPARLSIEGGAAVSGPALGPRCCSFCHISDRLVLACSKDGCKKGVHQECYHTAMRKPPCPLPNPSAKKARRSGPLCATHLDQLVPQVY